MFTEQDYLLAAKAAGLHKEWPKPEYEVTWNEDGLWCSGMGMVSCGAQVKTTVKRSSSWFS